MMFAAMTLSRTKPWRILAAACLVWTLWIPAAQAEAFVAPSLGNLVKTMIRFGALNIRDDNVIDDYAIANECKIYTHFEGNDFRWHDVQTALRKSIRQDVELYPTGFYYDAVMELDHYDFSQKIFRFSGSRGRQNVNAFILSADGDKPCGEHRLTVIPDTFNFVLDRTIFFPGIPLDEDQAKELLRRMEERNNGVRVVYARFNLKVSYIAPMHKTSPDKPDARPIYWQSNNVATVRIDSHLDSIAFYEDEARTKLIIQYTP